MVSAGLISGWSPLKATTPRFALCSHRLTRRLTYSGSSTKRDKRSIHYVMSLVLTVTLEAYKEEL